MCKLLVKVFLLSMVFVLSACSSQSDVYNTEIIPVFKKYSELNQQFLKTADLSLEVHMKAREEVEKYSIKEYVTALQLFEKEYCKNPQEDALDEFITVLLSTRNSANEMPSYVLGSIYKCKETQVMAKIDSMDKQQRGILFEILKDAGITQGTK